MTERDQSNTDLVTTHTAFRNNHGHPLVLLCSCGWKVEVQRQNAATARAKHHIDTYPDHEVLTTRVQSKLTFSRKRVR